MSWPIEVFVLHSARDKLKSAWSHINKLERAIKKAKVDGLVFDSGTYRDDLVIRYHRPVEVFSYLSLTIGQIVHQARSALEHAIWQMVPEEKRGKRTGFPVISSEQVYDKLSPSMIGGINPRAAKLVKSWQPFKKGPKCKLNQLHGLWNIDKHRSLTACIALPVGGVVECVCQQIAFDKTLRVKESKKTFTFEVPEYLTDDMEVFRKRAPKNLSHFTCSVHVTEIVFAEDPMKGIPVVKGLKDLVRCAESIVESLDKTIES